MSYQKLQLVENKNQKAKTNKKATIIRPRDTVCYRFAHVNGSGNTLSLQLSEAIGWVAGSFGAGKQTEFPVGENYYWNPGTVKYTK